MLNLAFFMFSGLVKSLLESNSDLLFYSYLALYVPSYIFCHKFLYLHSKLFQPFHSLTFDLKNYRISHIIIIFSDRGKYLPQHFFLKFSKNFTFLHRSLLQKKTGVNIFYLIPWGSIGFVKLFPWGSIISASHIIINFS